MANRDEQTLDWAKVEALAQDLGAADFHDVVATALGSMEIELRALHTAIKRDNRERASRLAHALRSNFELFGARRAAKVATDIERNAVAGRERTDLRDDAAELASAWDALKAQLLDAVKRLGREK